MGEILQFRLLGSPLISLGDIPIGEKLAAKDQAILFYLAVTGRPQSRATLAGLLWGDVPEAAARASLRKAISSLRETIGDYLEIDNHTLAFKPRQTYWVDVAAFAAAVEQSSVESIGALQAAVDLYRGDFLTGYYVRNAPDFETWALTEQTRLRELAIETLHLLTVQLAEQGQLRQAISFARRLLTLEPWREETHRQLMLMLAQSGQRGAALAQYESCREILAEELGVEPGTETNQLYERIRDDQIERETSAPIHSQPTIRSDPKDTPPSNRPHLPSQPTTFIGRETEVLEIKRLLLEESDCRLLTLIGPGGIGKSRLAQQAAAAVADDYCHGIHLVPLAPVTEPALIVSAIGEALQLNFQGSSEPIVELLSYLTDKQLLLILDNFEHLSEGAELLSALLNAADQVNILVTSREQLNLQEAWVYRVEGMSFPTNPATIDTNAKDFSAVRLFLERARRAKAGYNPSPEDMAAVVRICQLVDGMPLALELAAPWVRSLTCGEIVQELTQNMDLLTTSMRDVPIRHRSIRAILAQSWQQLSPTEQETLSQLSIFRGGWRREAAVQVTDATLTILTTLVDKALLRRHIGGRYELHELIRQFATEQLQANPALAQSVQKRHTDHFLTLLETHGNAFLNDQAQQKSTLAVLIADIDNIRAAWHEAIDRKDTLALGRAAIGLWMLGEYGSQAYESELALRQAVTAYIPPGEQSAASIDPQEDPVSIAMLLAALGHLAGRRGKLDEGRRLSEEAVLRARQAGPPAKRTEAIALLGLGFVLAFQGRFTEAKQRAAESMTLFAGFGDRRNVATLLLLQGEAAYGIGELDEAQQFLEQSLLVFRAIDEKMERGYAVQRLALVAIRRGDYARAGQLLDEDFQTRQTFNDNIGLKDLLKIASRLAIIRGQIAQADAYIRQGLEFYGGTDRLDARAFLMQLGVVKRLQGDLDEAESLIRESIELARIADHQPDLAEGLHHLAVLAANRGDYEQAESYLQQSLTIWQQIKNEPEMAIVLCQLGHRLTALSETHQAEARHHYLQALRLAVHYRLAPVALDVFTGLANLAVCNGDTQQAIDLLTLVERHPAATDETRQQAKSYLAELIDRRPAATVKIPTTRRDQSDWQKIADQLMQTHEVGQA